MADHLDNSVIRNIDARKLKVHMEQVRQGLHMDKMAGILADKLVDKMRANQFVVRHEKGRKMATVRAQHKVGDLGSYETERSQFGNRTEKAYGRFLRAIQFKVSDLLQQHGVHRFSKRHATWEASRSFDEPALCCLPLAWYQPFSNMVVRVDFDVTEI